MKAILVFLLTVGVLGGALAAPDDAPRLDIAPFAIREAAATSQTLRWEEPRQVERLVLTFDGDAPAGEPVVEYWQRHWPEKRITEADLKKGGGRLGWQPNDDWFNGQWQRARIRTSRAGRQLNVTFAPLGGEFPELARVYNVAFRQTNQVRVRLAAEAPPLRDLRVYTDTALERREVTIETNCRKGGAPEVAPWRWEDSRVQIYNGVLERFERPSPGASRARLTFRCARPGPLSADRTIVTLRQGDAATTASIGFSFRPDDLDAAPQRIWAPDLGVLIAPASANLHFSDLRADQLTQGRTIYDRIAGQPEQSVAQALSEMPPKRPMHIIIGCEGRRQKFGVDPGGDLFAREGFLRKVPGADTPRLRWPGKDFRLKLFWNEMTPEGRSVEAGHLPLLRARYVRGDLEIEQEVCATVLGGIAKPVRGDDAVAALMRLTFRNRGTRPYALAQRLAFASGAETKLTLEGDRIAMAGPRPFTWALAGAEGSPGAAGTLALAPGGKSVTYSVKIPPGQTRALVLKVPYVALNESELARLRAIRFDEEWGAVRRYWASRLAAGAQMKTGVADLDDFWLAHVTHVLINDDQEPGSDRLIGRVSSFNYGNFSNESIMQIMDLDRRGYHEEARRHLETYLHYQGTVALPGNFTDHDGVFYGSGGYEAGGYNQHHGWVLWGLAEHYRLTGDRAWLLQRAGRIAKGCEWVLRQCETTRRTDRSGRRVLEYGFMPAGGLEDVQDYHTWLSTNALTCRGLLAAAEALAEAGYAEGPRLLREARRFQAELRAGFEEMRLRAPLVRLRDGSFVPDYPSRLYERGRDLGWIREVLEGSINLIGPVLDPRGPEATWILKDYEDNRYLDAPYNYPLDDFERQWFGRGGFSYQPNLWYFPPPYLERDQVEHFLRALFNGFAACWRADLRAMTEHPLPGLGDWAGDHFKSSDEAMVAYWLRLMFAQESGGDLYLGRGLPRACLAPGKAVYLKDAETQFGKLGVTFETAPDGRRMTARIDAPDRRAPEKMYVRFRHPERKRIAAARVDGRSVEFNAEKEWVVVSGGKRGGRMTVEADFE